jgi:hypothetical protein
VRAAARCGKKTGVKPLISGRSVLVTLLFSILLPQWSCGPKKSADEPSAQRKSIAATAAELAPAPKPRPVRILFVGNSYTFYNGGIPAVLTAMAKSRGRDVEAVPSVSGGKSLEWHWEEGTARHTIENGGPWDYVVLQDYSTRAITDAPSLFTYARKFDAEIRKAGAKTAFFMTWARYNQPETQATITQAYDKIARELGAPVARVGPAFERVLDEKPSIRLHMDDRSHPTPAGTYLAACVFYATLLNDSPVGLPATLQLANGKTLEVDPADAKVVQKVAEHVARARGD